MSQEKKTTIRDHLVIAGDHALSTLEAPVRSLIGKDKSSGALGLTLVLGVLTWPISIPCLLIFGRVHKAYAKRFDVEASRRRLNGQISREEEEAIEQQYEDGQE